MLPIAVRIPGITINDDTQRLAKTGKVAGGEYLISRVLLLSYSYVDVVVMLNFFQDELLFNQSIKSFYLVLSVILGLLFYLIVCYFIKAFQMNDIKLKY